MRITRSRKFTVSMGNFESYRFGAEVTVDHNDLGYTDADVAGIASDGGSLDTVIDAITDVCMTVLNDQLADEIRDAARLTNDEKSFLLDSFTDSNSKRTRTRKVKR